MKQFSFCLKTIADFDAWAQSFRETCPQEARTVFVSVFSGWADEEAMKELLLRLSEMLPDAVVVGCTSTGEIMSGQLIEQTAVLNFMFFDKADVRIHAMDFLNESPEEAADSLSERLREKNVVGVGLLVSENNEQAYRFLTRLNSASPASHVKVFGAFSGTTGDAKECVFAGERMIHQGAVAFCFIGRDLHVHVNTCIGWRPLGPSFNITKMDGGNVIRELDGNPAQYVYQKYLGLSREEINFQTLLFPLCVKRKDTLIMRLPLTCTEEGALVFGGDCREGERVQLAYGSPEKMLDADYNACKDIIAFEPEALLLFNCISRRFFLREDTGQELQPFQAIAASAGLYVHGEISKDDNGNISLLNMSLVAVSFREGPKSGHSSSALSLEPRAQKFTNTLKFINCLANFVEVTSAESEIVNAQLAHLASIDRLTGLYNRGEIESILRKTLLKNRANDDILSAIMFDLDDFKHINDTFGHALGDAALRRCAKAIRENIRKSDSAGRWGGEEFLIVLPGTPLDAAKTIAENIRTALKEKTTLPDGRFVTGSFGVAKFPDNGSAMTFYKQLDQALYRAKENGKNCVCVAGENQPDEAKRYKN